MNLTIVQPGVLYHWLQAGPEEVHTQLLKPSPRDLGVEVDAFKESINLHIGLGARRQDALGPFAGGPQTPQGPLVLVGVTLVLPPELGHKVIHHAVVEVFSAEVSIASCGFDLKHGTIGDAQHGHIKCSSSQVEDQHILLVILQVLLSSPSQSSCCGFIDYSEGIGQHAAGIFGVLCESLK